MESQNSGSREDILREVFILVILALFVFSVVSLIFIQLKTSDKVGISDTVTLLSGFVSALLFYLGIKYGKAQAS
ncbi:MAG: hypothetical protein JRN20_17905 [Nitrososphaerota archaeon]|nr:hypothetical protein [Nitrososphaerota archaeon]